MLLSRDELIITLFRETDRAQRMKTPLAVILCGIAEWESCKARFSHQTWAEVQRQLAERMICALRCYDSGGTCGDGKFGLVLPGCNSFGAVAMAERLSSAAFGMPVTAGREDLKLTGCFGIAGSGGRSPLVVLRNAEDALRKARALGPGSIERSSYDAEPDPATLVACRW